MNACPHCGEEVLDTEPRDKYVNSCDWYHIACFARPILGSVAHIEKRCSCFVPGSDEGDDPALTKREAAVASMRASRLAHTPWNLREKS